MMRVKWAAAVAILASAVPAIGYTVFGDALARNARLGDWREAQIRTACLGALERPERDPLMPKFPVAQHHIDLQDSVRMLEATAALNCYVVTHRNAVCDRNNRAYIVASIGRYFEHMDSMLATASRHGEAEVRLVARLWNSPRHQAIAAALQDHIRQGRLAKADFGWSAPKALAPALTQHANALDACGREAAPVMAGKQG